MSANQHSSLSTALSLADQEVADAQVAGLLPKIEYLGPEGVQQVLKALGFATKAHQGQWRKNGDPYITHPVAVASICTKWHLDAQALCASLLHDAIEDCGISKADLILEFGATVADLVDGLTKLDKLQFATQEQGQAESFRKMFLAMARDVRVILIKLADRLHNMRTLSGMPNDKRVRISSDTLDIYAPIADRLGLNEVFLELQDLCFSHLKPWRYRVLEKAISHARRRRRDLLKLVETEVETTLIQAGLKVQIYGREKTLYSIYNKMRSKHLSFAQVSDIYGMRLIFPHLLDCYCALGVLHQLYKPVPGRFKDYIAISKRNGYQSLHTTLASRAGINVEFQLRTHDMHVTAESGVAAHWMYKTHDPNRVAGDQMGAQWMQSLLDIQNETRDAMEFLDHVKIDLSPEAIYVFTPKNRILALPRGATVVDFAYAVHSDLGNHLVASQVNGETVPLRTELRNGDVVEVMTAPTASPNPAWLGYVRSGRARSSIRHHLKSLAQSESEQLGYQMLAQALRAEGFAQSPGIENPNQELWQKLLRFTGNNQLSELLIDISLGRKVAAIVAKRLGAMLVENGAKADPLLITAERFTDRESNAQGAVLVDGSENSTVQYPSCCHPLPGDAIVGYLGHGEALVVHRAECPTALKQRHKDKERFIVVEWSERLARSFETPILVTALNGKGLLAQVAGAIAQAEGDITQANTGSSIGMAESIELQFMVAVRDLPHLDAVLRGLRRCPSVSKVMARPMSAGHVRAR